MTLSVMSASLMLNELGKWRKGVVVVMKMM